MQRNRIIRLHSTPTTTKHITFHSTFTTNHVFTVYHVLISTRTQRNIRRRPHMIIKQITRSLHSTPLLSSRTIIRRMRILHNLPRRTRIINSRRRNRVRISHRQKSRNRGHLLHNRIRHNNQLINSRCLKSISSHRDSRRTLRLTTQRLVQMQQPRTFNIIRPSLTRLFRRLNLTLNNTRLLLIMFRQFHSLYTRHRRQVRHNKQFLRRHTSMFTTSTLRQHINNRRVSTTTNNILTITTQAKIQPIIRGNIIGMHITLRTNRQQVRAKRHRHHRQLT